MMMICDAYFFDLVGTDAQNSFLIMSDSPFPFFMKA